MTNKRHYKKLSRLSLPSLSISSLLLVSPGPAVFGHLVLLPVPGGFGGEIAALEPAGEGPGVVMGDPVFLQFGDLKETLGTDVAKITCEILSSMLSHQVLLKSE